MDYQQCRKCVVFLSDFGTVDGAVSAMHAVADDVDETLRLEDLTHEIPQFNIWEASYRLIQALTYWKKGTVFVCVVGFASKCLGAPLELKNLFFPSSFFSCFGLC